MDQKLNVTQMDRKFASHYDAVEQELKSNTIGKYVKEQPYVTIHKTTLTKLLE